MVADLLSALRVSTTATQALGEGFRQHSADISSAQDPDYQRQEIIFTSRGPFRGSRLVAIKRVEDDNLLSELLNSLSNQGFASALSEYGGLLQRALGFDGDNPLLVTAFEEYTISLVALQSSPESDLAERRVVESLTNLVDTIRSFSSSLVRIKNQILGDLSQDVIQVNQVLVDIRELNQRIQRAQSHGIATSGLEGERDGLLRELAEFLPIQTLRANDFGAVNVYSQSGNSLVSGSTVAELQFDAGTRILTIEGVGQASPLATAEGRLNLRGGSLASKFDLVLENTAATTHTLSETPQIALIDKLQIQLDEFSNILFQSSENTAYGAFVGTPNDALGLLFAGAAGATTADATTITLNSGFSALTQNRFKIGILTTDDLSVNLIAGIRNENKGITNADLAVSLRLNDRNYQGLLNGIISNSSAILNGFDDTTAINTEVSEQLRDNLSNRAGVNIDETLLLVNQIQKAYSANTRIFSTIDEVLAELLAVI